MGSFVVDIPPDNITIVNTDTHSLEEYAKAEEAATDAADKYLQLSQGIVEAKLRMKQYYILGGKRGITTNIFPSMNINVSGEWPSIKPGGPENDQETPLIYIEWKTLLEEGCAALPDDHPGYYHDFPPLERTAQYTCQMYEQIQGTMEWFFIKRGEKFQGRPLDRGNTNILEPGWD